MTTITQARAAVRSRIEAAGLTVSLRWQNEDGGPLPGQPSAFVYTEFNTEKGNIAGYGGGRGGNLYRNRANVESWVFVPKGEGLTQAESIAETIAALFRSYRDSYISCFDATVYPGGDGAALTPPGMHSDVGNYFWAAVEVSLHFDQVG
ncbi:hypothetical protein [Mesorhizobium sp. KR9-304]|uniref:hypothetical protein n=1 Tax=Mesorhizobium sp. KR9-304 TaxID=3156614 RepID=UPI0032B3D6CE